MDLSHALSEHFTLRDLVKSQTATRRQISNIPNLSEIENLSALCEKVLEPIWETLGPVKVLSGFRTPELNRIIGGARNSQHMTGLAVDIEVPGRSNYRLSEWIQTHLIYDQLIEEYMSDTDPLAGWVHCSFVTARKNRQLLIKRTI